MNYTPGMFEQAYQAEFNPMKEAYPLNSEIFSGGKVYRVTDYVISGNKRGVVGIDREGNEREIYDGEPVRYKVCGRCGGSGRHSWNQTHGSTCYGCSGKGKNTLAPSGFPQKIKAVCAADLPKFGYVKGDEMTGEFCGFSKTGGTPKYLTHNPRRRLDTILLHSTIVKHFEI